MTVDRSMMGLFLIAASLLALAPLTQAAAESQDLAFKHKEAQFRGPDKFSSGAMWAAIARDRAELRELWSRYEQQGPVPTIGFEKNFAVLAGAGGSSSCPHRLHHLRLDPERKRIRARLYEPHTEPPVACTDDLVPRTITVAVKRSDIRPFDADDLSVRPRRIDDPNQ